MSESVVTVQDLVVQRGDGAVVVDHASFSLSAGAVLGVVGESGCGKTTMGLAMLGFARPGLRLESGSVRVAGHEMLGRPGSELRPLRGSVVSYVPQDPATALNPSLRIETQIANVLQTHRSPRSHTIPGILTRVQLPSDRAFRRRFPHELSGGQQQRVALAIALVCDPKLTVMDEPTTGLDVVVQARLLHEIDEIRRERGISLIYVSHDLAVVASIADQVAVMYAGRIVEMGLAGEIIEDPRHPYTRGLVSSMPSHREPRRPTGIPGVVAAPVPGGHLGCSFVARCTQSVASCHDTVPALEPTATVRQVRCPEWRAHRRCQFSPGPPSPDHWLRRSSVSADSKPRTRAGSPRWLRPRTCRSRSPEGSASLWSANRAAGRPRSPVAWSVCTRRDR